MKRLSMMLSTDTLKTIKHHYLQEFKELMELSSKMLRGSISFLNFIGFTAIRVVDFVYGKVLP